MRILMVNSQRAAVGGVEKYLAGLMKALASRGHQLGFAYEHEANDFEERVDAGLDEGSLWEVAGHSLPEVLDGIQKWAPDCVFVHGCRHHGFEAALTEAYPSYLFAHDHQRTCPTGKRTFMRPQVAACSQKAGVACLACYYPKRCGGLNPVSALRCFGDWRTSWESIQRYRTVFVASQAMKRQMTLQGLAASAIEVLPPFNSEAEPDEVAPAPRAFTNRLVFMGRLVREKGADLLINALDRVASELDRPMELVIAGEGSERKRLEKLAKSARAPVHFAGWLNAAARTAALRCSDLLVMPSVWPEPYGMVGVEAGALGVPAVAFAVGGVTEWLEPGVSGELAGSANPSAASLAEAIISALADAQHHQKLRVGAWRMARTMSGPRHAEQLERTFRRRLHVASSYLH